MYLGPRKKKINRRFKVKTTPVPAPVGGLNARDSIADMPPDDAVILDNWFPTPTNIQVRNGYSSHNTSPTGWVETLMTYNGLTSNQMFSVDTNGDLREVTTSSTGGSALITGLTNARWQYINFSTAGGQYLMCVNGADQPRLYDGTTWSATTITGPTLANLIHINNFKNRIWLTEKNSMKMWYLGVNSIGGAATSFDLGPVFKLGGYIMGMVTWTVNEASGIDDYACFVSSQGEVVVYKGYDPSSASTWALTAQFRMGRPVGRRFYNKIGSDVVMITADGAVMLSQSLLTDRSSTQKAISNKIVNLITADVQAYNANFGWQIVFYPIGNKVIINVPKSENSRQYQYVMNTITGAWCTYGYIYPSSAWSAACFELLNDSIYFGGNGTVYKCDTGSADNGGDIIATAKPAFNYFGNRGLQKFFTMLRPYFESVASVSASIGLNVDFADVDPTSTVPVTSGSTTSPWDTSYWDVSYWSGESGISKNWQTVTGIGVAATVKIIVQGQQPISLQAIDYVHEQGGIL